MAKFPGLLHERKHAVWFMRDLWAFFREKTCCLETRVRSIGYVCKESQNKLRAAAQTGTSGMYTYVSVIVTYGTRITDIVDNFLDIVDIPNSNCCWYSQFVLRISTIRTMDIPISKSWYIHHLHSGYSPLAWIVDINNSNYGWRLYFVKYYKTYVSW
jgi:hypothetical protein